ncbi:hypothetical protein L202_03443 [Cryptococcus amylolentus CBS 6039]|uniref:Uncharacterized protein n=2 Tax=Cryptococcus amylolentus TaxID=104669 RepID=A0A1E3HSY6_9TREE|nr:hypothetical protein L202_03443 [Cryptococcus amylolentus CBS 6039]ODN79469.1 hypothetical protein L202_03443 [Cryptococcus amylolentus CBS 6039]
MATHPPLPQPSLATPYKQHVTGLSHHMPSNSPYSAERFTVTSGSPSQMQSPRDHRHPSPSPDKMVMNRGRGQYGPQLGARESTEHGERQREIEPMLPPVARTRPRTQEPMVPQDESSVPPAPPPKTAATAPTTPASGGEQIPLSKRLFHTLVNKPKLSKTWEKKSFTDELRSAPAALGESTRRGRTGVEPGEGFASPRSRPTSLYASPADLASFRPLPLMMEERHHHSDSEVGNSARTAEGDRI